MKPVRTDEEKEAFAKECLMIERIGGDVLGFIEKNWPSYTPRATWYNLQRQYLSRKRAEKLTEGKQKNGGVIDMERRNTGELLTKVIALIEEGKDPIAYLTSIGYKAASQSYTNLRSWAKKNRPEDFAKLPDNLRDWKLKNGMLKQSWQIPQETAEKAASAACELNPTDDSPKAPETQETATETQTEALPEQKKETKAKMKVIEVETDLGSFRKEDEKIAFRRVDDGTDYKNQLKMTVPQWKQLIAEMDDVLNMLEEIEY